MNHDTKKIEKRLMLKLNLALQLLPSSDCSLLVDGFHHRERVAGQHVVHLVPQRRLTQQLRATHQVADGHVEVGVPARPVGDPRERVSHQNVLKQNINLVGNYLRFEVTLVWGWIKLTPCLLIAIRSSSG